MQFTYPHGVRTIEEAMRQGIGALSQPGHPLVEEPLETAIDQIAVQTLSEFRTILVGELTTLFDHESIAVEWNDAIEKAILLVEGLLP